MSLVIHGDANGDRVVLTAEDDPVLGQLVHLSHVDSRGRRCKPILVGQADPPDDVKGFWAMMPDWYQRDLINYGKSMA